MPITRMIPAQYGMVGDKYQKVADQYLETIAHGKVLKVGSRTCQIMSDVWGTEKYATYWDEDSKSIKTVILDVCDYQYAYGDQVHAEVDATPEVYAALRNYLFQNNLAKCESDARNQAAEIRKESIVKVVSGRNGKGTQGKVVVAIERPYSMGWRQSLRRKFGIATSDRKVKVAASNGKVYENYADLVWAWAHNCELAVVPDVDMEQVKQDAAERTEIDMLGWVRQ